MKKLKLSLMWTAGVVAGATLVASCGGGGGGGGGGITPSIPYSGISTPAFITSENAVSLAMGVCIELGRVGSSGGAMPDTMGGGGLGTPDPGNNLSSLPELLGRTAARYTEASAADRAVFLSAFDDTVSGRCEGHADVSGSLEESSGKLDFDMIYHGYSDDCITYFSGAVNFIATMDLDTFQILPSMEITYGALTATIGSEAITLSGTWAGDYDLIPPRETMNMVIRDDGTGKTYWLKDFVTTMTVGSDASGGYADLDMQGRYYDPDQGYADVTTQTPARTYSHHWYPSAGALVLSGGNSSTGSVAFESQVYFEVYCDADGDGEDEFDSGLIPWPWQDNYTVFARDLGSADSNWSEPGKAAIAYDGTNYLVVTRRVTGWNSSTTIGMFVSNLGAILDTFTVSESGSNDYSLAFDGTNFLLVYSYNDGSGGKITGQRITTSGTTLDGPSGFLIAGSDSNGSPAVAFDGAGYLVVWPKYINGGYDIYGARVSTGGQVSSAFPVLEASGEQVMVSLAFGGENFLAVWRDTRSGSGPTMDTDIYGARISTSASVLDAGGIPVCASSGLQEYPTLAFDGNNYFVVWADYRTTPTFPHHPEIYGSRVTTAGIVLDTEGIPIKTGDFEGQGYPSLDFDGTHFLLGWQVGSFSIYPPSGIFAERLTTEGQPVDSTGDSLGTPVSGLPPEYATYIWPVVKSGGSNSLVVWTNNIELYGEQKDLRGTVVPDLDQFL